VKAGYKFVCAATQPVLARLAAWCVVSLLLSAAMPARAQQNSRTPTGNFDQIAKQATEASEQNRLDDASELYRQALALRSNWADGWWALGTLEYDRDNYAEAAKAFRKLSVLAPKNGTARVMLGLSEFELGQDAVALKHIQEGDQLGVTNNTQLRDVAVFHEGVLLIRAEKFSEGMTRLTALCAAGVQSKELVETIGMAVFGLTPKEAPGEGAPGRDVILRAGRAECFLAHKQPDDARREYDALMSEYPEYPNLHYVYGRFLLELHETDNAIAQFQEELKRNPKHLNAMLQIAAVRYRTDSDAGVAYAKQAIALAPKLPFAHYLLGLLLLDIGQAAEAIPELETARQGLPKEPSLYFALGNAYAKVGRTADAAKARATFRQLNAAKKPESGANVYEGQGSSLVDEKLRKSAPEQP